MEGYFVALTDERINTFLLYAEKITLNSPLQYFQSDFNHTTFYILGFGWIYFCK